MTNLEWLYSLEPDELKAWFEAEHKPVDKDAERVNEGRERLARAVAYYRDMFGE